MALYSTHAEEAAARRTIEENRGFKATHSYDPIGWDRADPRGVRGEPITPGSDVQLMKEHTKALHTGMPGTAKKMFNVVRDESGNFQHVSLSSINRLFKDRRTSNG